MTMKHLLHKPYWPVALLSAALLAGLNACDRLDIPGMIINRSDTEERVADWLDYNAQHGMPVFNNVPDNYCFYSCSDSHINDDNSRLKAYITAERNDPEAMFSIIAGDIANEQGDRSFVLCEEAMGYDPSQQAENDPCFPIIGNHDVYFDCAEHFKNHFHTSTYAVTVNTVSGYKDLFLFLDSGNGTHGRRQLDWLEVQLSHRTEYRHCFVISHNWLFRTTYNYTTTPAANLPEDEQYAFMDLMSRNDVDMVIMGHFHHRETQHFNHVTYVMTDNLNDAAEASYLVVRCADKVSYEYRVLDL